MLHKIRFWDALLGQASVDNMDYKTAADTEVADKGFVDMDSVVVGFVDMGSVLAGSADKDSVDCYPDSMDFATGFAHCIDHCHLVHFRRNSSQNLRIIINIIIVYETI